MGPGMRRKNRSEWTGRKFTRKQGQEKADDAHNIFNLQDKGGPSNPIGSLVGLILGWDAKGPHPSLRAEENDVRHQSRPPAAGEVSRKNPHQKESSTWKEKSDKRVARRWRGVWSREKDGGFLVSVTSGGETSLLQGERYRLGEDEFESGA